LFLFTFGSSGSSVSVCFVTVYFGVVLFSMISKAEKVLILAVAVAGKLIHD
jgi:hypothetical protein